MARSSDSSTAPAVADREPTGLFGAALLLGVATLVWGCGAATEAPREPPPPAEPDRIHAWLSAGKYVDWESESRVHPGLNGTGRRVFLGDDVLRDASPVGAAGVRELYDGHGPDSEQIGWSMLIKVDDSGDAANDWYFYETFELDQPDQWAIAERGARGCLFCHGAAPDVIQSRRPLP